MNFLVYTLSSLFLWLVTVWCLFPDVEWGDMHTSETNTSLVVAVWMGGYALLNWRNLF